MNKMYFISFILIIGFFSNLFATEKTHSPEPSEEISEERTQKIKQIFAEIPGLDIETPKTLIGEPMVTLGGESIELTTLRGKFSVVSFVASWCPHCQREMPSFHTLYENFSNRDEFDMMIIFVGEEKKTVQSYIQKNEYNIPAVLDLSTRVARMNRVNSTPTTYVVDPEGNIMARRSGAFAWDRPEILAALNAALSLWEEHEIRIDDAIDES